MHEVRAASLDYKHGFQSKCLTRESPFSRDSSTGTQKTVKKHKKPAVQSFLRGHTDWPNI